MSSQSQKGTFSLFDNIAAQETRIRTKMRSLLIAAITMLVAAQGHAQMTLLSDNRNVNVYLEALTPDGLDAKYSQTPSAPFDPALNVSGTIGWDEINGWQAAPTSASAMQEATFAPSQIAFNSYLSVDSGGDPYGFHFPTPASGTAQASSYFEVTFNIADPVEFDYSLDFDVSPILQSANCTLSSVNHGVQQLFRTYGGSASGTLEADTYTLRFDFSSVASGDHAGDTSSSMVFNLQMASSPAPVPEPSTTVLFGLALAGFVVFRLNRAQKEARALALQRIRKDNPQRTARRRF